MKLSWNDAAATVLAALVVVVMVGVAQGMDWPFLGTDRSSILTLLVMGAVMCPLATRNSLTSARDLVHGPFMSLASILGAVALALVAIGLLAPSRAIVLAVGFALLALWVVTTTRHAVGGRVSGRLAH
jgi:hypothetical protein